MADRLTFVEILPDAPAQPSGWESLGAGSRRRPPRWLLRAIESGTAARMRSAAVAVVALGGVLAADGTGAAPVPRGDVVIGLCPSGAECRVEGRARQDMWAVYNRLFVDTKATGGSVWYDPASGRVHRQELTAVSVAEPLMTVTLVEQRINAGEPLAFGPTIDGFGRGRGPTGRRALIVSAARGQWLLTATLTGPRSRLLPLDAALQWVHVAPLPD